MEYKFSEQTVELFFNPLCSVLLTLVCAGELAAQPTRSTLTCRHGNGSNVLESNDCTQHAQTRHSLQQQAFRLSYTYIYSLLVLDFLFL